MKYVNEHTRLTDSLERELIAGAIQEQMEFRPGEALKSFFTELVQRLGRKDDGVTANTAESAS